MFLKVQSHCRQTHSSRGCAGKVACPKRRALYVTQAMQRYGISERHACLALGVHRSTIRRPLKKADDAIYIDSTNMSLEDVVKIMTTHIEKQ